MLARVAALRMDAGIDQKTIAEIAGWTAANWCSLEKGRLKLPKKRRGVVAERLGVPEDVLFSDDGKAVMIPREELVPA